MELTGSVQGMIDLMGGGSDVEVTQVLTSGEKIATITIDDTPTDIYAPEGSGVEVTQVLTSGEKIATITIDDTPTDIYAPSPTAPTEVEVTPVVSSGTKIATITVNNTPTDIYAPMIHYDTNEQVIGTYLREPLYQKTWVFTNNITIQSNQWTDTPISNTGIKDIISVEALNDEGTMWALSGARTISGNYVQVYSFRNTTLQVNRITLRYTKSI